MIKIPTELNKDAKDFWKANAPAMLKDGRLTENTKSAFVMLCRMYARYLDAERTNLDANKVVALCKQVQNLMKSFHMTPDSRRKLSNDDEPQDIHEALGKLGM